MRIYSSYVERKENSGRNNLRNKQKAKPSFCVPLQKIGQKNNGNRRCQNDKLTENIEPVFGRRNSN